MPASAVWCCGRRCVSCGRLSRFVLSLASAGNVCWAKPNHGFFGCQQPDAKKFPPRRDDLRGRMRLPRATRRSRRARSAAKEIHASRKTSGKRMFCRCGMRADRAARVTHAMLRRRADASLKRVQRSAAKRRACRALRVAQAGLRENCANFSCASRRSRPARAHSTHAQNGRTRDVAAAGSDASGRIAKGASVVFAFQQFRVVVRAQQFV